MLLVLRDVRDAWSCAECTWIVGDQLQGCEVGKWRKAAKPPSDFARQKLAFRNFFCVAVVLSGMLSEDKAM